MFLFDLVTGKSPSAKDPTTNKYMRDVMLKKDPQEPIVEHVDQNVGYDLWAKFLYCFGKDCTNPIANKRPKMGSVNDALEQLIKGQPQALAMQVCIFPPKQLVYDRNHYFGFGPIPKPKLADTVGKYLNRYRYYILKGESSYQ